MKFLFLRRVVVPRPDIRGREEILKVHTRKIPLAEDVDLAVLARGSPGFSGADLASLVNEAALYAARVSKKVVFMVDFEGAKDKVLMGTPMYRKNNGGRLLQSRFRVAGRSVCTSPSTQRPQGPRFGGVGDRVP